MSERTLLTPEELADYEFVERVAIITEGCKVSERAALEMARRQREQSEPDEFGGVYWPGGYEVKRGDRSD